jgi:hypothetical protein
MKKLMEELGEEIPQVSSSVLAAMGNIRTTHLIDPKLW